jgi:hypothetical protein
MPKLNWISDLHLFEAIQHLMTKANEAVDKVNNDFEKNVIDPFSAIFSMSGFQMDYDTWIKSEVARQAQKTLQNHIGEFHQNILGKVNNWKNMKTGSVIDLVSTEKKVIAEIKNKHNTISGGKLSDLYYSLDHLVMPKASIYKGYTSYYVSIIPRNKTRFNKAFVPSDKEKGARCAKNESIREIDGASFYHLVTGEKNALSDLYNILPNVIEECTKGAYKIDQSNKLRAFFDSAFETVD